MKNLVLHILIIGWLCLGWSACTCNNEEPLQENTSVEVGFTLSTGGYASRATHGTAEDEPGTGYENYIDIAGRDFRFYIFDADNKFIDELKVLTVMPMDNSEYPTTYYLTAQLHKVPSSDEQFKVVAIASWDNYPTGLERGVTTIEDICEASAYRYTHPFIPSRTQKIPMYGVKTHDPVEFKPNLCTDLGEINMLRAMAKVEVRLGSGVQDYTLESVQLVYHTENGMAAPIGIYDNTDGDCEATLEALHMDHNYTVSVNPIDFEITSEMNAKVIYIPEYKNVDFEVPSYIIVNLKHGNHIKTDYIYFRNYVAGKPGNERIDIIRNHHYLFTITSIGGSIEVNYTVADWNHEPKDENGDDKHRWEQDFDYPTYENVIPWSYVGATDPNMQITQEPIMYYDQQNPAKGAFTVGFRMLGPDGQKWNPTFRGTEDKYSLEVYRLEGTELKGVELNNLVASEFWYQIRLIPTVAENTYLKNDDGTTRGEVEFGISTTLSWANQTIFLLINGQDEQTIRWPKEIGGTDARIIRVRQVAPPQSNAGNENTGQEG